MSCSAARVVSVNVGLPKAESWAGRPQRTSIAKHQVAGPVRVWRDHVEGDEPSDTKYHGGPGQAVYVYAREDLDFWTGRLGRGVPPGMFGENLTTEGIDVNAAVLGERWRVGTTLLQVSTVRTPCRTFKNWLDLGGYDTTAWLKRFTAERRPGPYLSVLEEGHLQAGDPITVEERPKHGVTVVDLFVAWMSEQERLPDLLETEGLPEHVYAEVARKVRRRQSRSRRGA